MNTKRLCGKEQELSQYTSVSSIRFPANTLALIDTPWILHDLLKVYTTVNYHADCTNVYMEISISRRQNIDNIPHLNFLVIIHEKLKHNLILVTKTVINSL